jgi:hypothetical protein
LTTWADGASITGSGFEVGASPTVSLTSAQWVAGGKVSGTASWTASAFSQFAGNVSFSVVHCGDRSGF